MKHILALGALLISLSACTPDRNLPEPGYPYNPNLDTTERNDARIPYRGDWSFVAILADGTRRYGVASVLTRFTGSGFVNAGGGVAAWCMTLGCATSDEQGTVLFGTAGTGTAATLSIGMVPKNQTSARFVMSDADGQVTISEERPTISGAGIWRDATGRDQNATFGFVQVRSKSELATQSASSAPYRLAEQAARAVSATQQSAGLKSTFERALGQ